MTALLERAIEAHGGAERWAQITAVEARLRSGGLAFTMRMRPAPGELTYRVATREPRTTILDWPRPGRQAVFTPSRVWIEEDGRIVAARDDPRGYFRPLSRRAVRWDDLDLLYFVGYAVWNYLTTPFMLTWPGVETREAGDGRLDATFPPDFPTHSREQSFYFGEDGLLRRLDYTADVIGPYARAVHTCGEHRDFGGIVAPTRRRVVPRGPGDRPLPGPTLVWADVLELTPLARE